MGRGQVGNPTFGPFLSVSTPNFATKTSLQFLLRVSHGSIFRLNACVLFGPFSGICSLATGCFGDAQCSPKFFTEGMSTFDLELL